MILDVFYLCFEVKVDVVEYGCFCHVDGGGVGEGNAGAGYPKS